MAADTFAPLPGLPPKSIIHPERFTRRRWSGFRQHDKADITMHLRQRASAIHAYRTADGRSVVATKGSRLGPTRSPAAPLLWEKRRNSSVITPESERPSPYSLLSNVTAECHRHHVNGLQMRRCKIAQRVYTRNNQLLRPLSSIWFQRGTMNAL